MYHTHQLNNSAHSHIIGRTDPITGDKITKNDKVVFCKSCSSCFLEESWNYIGNNHCQQDETLDSVPLFPSKLLAKKNKNRIAFLEKGSDALGLSALFISTYTSVVVGFLLNKISYLITNLPEQVVTITIFLLSFCSFFPSLILIGHFFSSDFFRKIIGFKKQDISIFKNRIELKAGIFYWEDIREIKFQRKIISIEEIYSEIDLLINLKNGVSHRVILPNDNYKDVESFVKGLIEISIFTAVFLYTEVSQEYISIKKLAESSLGNIVIGEPFKLLEDISYSLDFRKSKVLLRI